jgi:hypothetical protein
MDPSVQPVKDFLSQLDKTLTTRRLYAPNMTPYREAGETLFERFQTAAGEVGFTLRVTSTDLYVGKFSVLHRDEREDSFFFPLYRDGLRELSFSPGVTLEELDGLLSTFEAERKRLVGPSQDTISFLWRCDLQSITFKAIDGIGDEEGDVSQDAAGDDYRALVADVMSKIQNPAAPETGQGYAFVVDADTRVAATDFHYEATTARRTFEENPTVLQLSQKEVATLRSGLEGDTEESLLKRFIEILFVMLMDPAGTISGATVVPVFSRLLEGYWAAGDYPSFCSLLSRLLVTSDGAPLPETRDGIRKILEEALTDERIDESLKLVESGSLALKEASILWGVAGDENWDLLLDFCWALPEGELREGVSTLLRKRLSSNPDLLRANLASEDVERVRAGLALIDESLDGLYQNELLGLATHKDQGIRLKGLTAAGRIGGPAALEVLWKAMESDPAKPVRLLAFRLVSTANFPELPKRLQALVTSPEFASRPVWEREKYVRLLGSVAGDSARPLFESWMPQKKWFWQAKDLAQAELALCGLAACGGQGLAQVQALAKEGGKLGAVATKVIGSSRDAAGAKAGAKGR